MSNIFDNMMKMYEDSHTSGVSNAKKYDLKNYFNTYLKEGVNSAVKTIRILPPTEGQANPFVIKWGHKTEVEGNWKTFACLKHENNEACPFCEAREVLLAEGTDADKELAKKFSARKMYVVKVIDRDNEQDGVKFWRFNHDYRKTGTMDKIMGAIAGAEHDITDIETGRDLTINVARDSNNRPVISSITCKMQVSPLSTDTEKVAEWSTDERTWRDVYSVKDYEYLKIVIKGDIPVYDKVKECYVGKSTLANVGTEKEDLDSELTMGTAKTTPTTTENTTTPKTEKVLETVTTSVAESEEDDDDLPF